MIATRKNQFSLGTVVATPAALATLERAQESASTFLDRHTSGDFGDVDDDDRQSNLDAIENDERIMSVYPLKNGEVIWIITEADRSSSCVLTPEDY